MNICNLEKYLLQYVVGMCSPKTMLKIGVAIAVPLAVGFIVFPSIRPLFISVAPFALFALCPLGMIFGMMGMKGGKHSGSCSSCNHDSHKK